MGVSLGLERGRAVSIIERAMSARYYWEADDVHRAIGAAWPQVLERLGIGSEYLRIKKQCPCPKCGGRDRYVFDNYKGRGDFLCRQECGAGDGFKLLMVVHGWDFPTALEAVLDASGLAQMHDGSTPGRQPAPPHDPLSAHTASAGVAQVKLPWRIRQLREGSIPLEHCPDAVAYLTTRCLWPYAADTLLNAHPAVPYFHDGELAGTYPALLADVLDVHGRLVTVHATYLKDGKKLTHLEDGREVPSRKLFSSTLGKPGCAVRVWPLRPGEVELGVTEGIEDAIAARLLSGKIFWAALSTSLLQRFVKLPPGVKILHIYADGDPAGKKAADRLCERLDASVKPVVHLPEFGLKDPNDVLQARFMASQQEDAVGPVVRPAGRSTP